MRFQQIVDATKLSRWLGPNSRPSPSQPGPKRKTLALEFLEDRCVPAALSIGDTTVVEGLAGTQNAAITVTLDQASTKTIKVNYATESGDARGGKDFEQVNGKLIFAPGELTKTILVPIRGDQLYEADESFFINLRGAKNAYISDGQGVVTILDNYPRVSISDAILTEGNAGSTLMTFNVTLRSPHDQTLLVNFATQDGTALSGEDYLASAGVLTFNPGDTVQSFTIEIYGDSNPEPDEYLIVNLSITSPRAVLTDSQAYGTILDDDGYVPPAQDPFYDPYYDPYYGYYDYGYYYYGYSYYDSYYY